MYIPNGKITAMLSLITIYTEFYSFIHMNNLRRNVLEKQIIIDENSSLGDIKHDTLDC